MKKVIIASMVGLFGLSLMVIGYLNEEGKQEVVVIDKTGEPTTTQTATQTATQTTTTTKKTTKKVVKTTKKTTKKVYKATKVATASKQTYIDYAKSISGYNDKQMSCLITLWNYESGWNPNSVNKSSGACGIPQAHPCTIAKYYGSNTWQNQIRWGIDYIKRRYHNKPCEALEHFNNHKPHWY